MKPFVVLTGASGSGKTAIAEAIEIRRPGFADVVRFDQVGVPSPDAMVRDWGSGEAWQRAMTVRWMATIADSRVPSRPLLFEGQMRLAFVREGLFSARISDAHVVLVDCDDVTRALRLRKHRDQADLANQTTMKWAAFLRGEARAAGHEVLDTSTLSLDASVDHVCALLRGP